MFTPFPISLCHKLSFFVVFCGFAGLQQSEYGRKLKTGKGTAMTGLGKPNFEWFGSFGLKFLKKRKEKPK